MQGTIVNPINLDLDQPEPQEDIEQQLELARRKQLLDQAKLSRNGIELALAVLKTTIKGELKHKNKTLNRAIIKYFEKRIGINISCEHFHSRKDPDYQNNPINPLEFLLYGVDFLSTSMIQDRFKLIDTTIQEIMWIDSSSCKLIFKTESQAKMVLESQVIDKRTLCFKLDEESDGQLQGWFTLRPYHFLNFQRQLIMRYSTQNENDMQKEDMNKYKDFETAYVELLPSLFQEFKAHQAYEQVMKEMEKEKLEDMQNRHQYRRGRRTNRYFDNRQPSRERQRTRDNKYQKYNNQARKNQNYNERDRNTSFEFINRDSRVNNKRQNINDINTSFQMAERAEFHRHREGNNIQNTSFEMQPSNQNRHNNRHNPKWQRNNNNRGHNTGNHNQFQAKVVHQVVYEHRPVDSRQMNTHSNRNNERHLHPPRQANVYFDCNGIDDQESLSYEFRPQLEQNNQESDNIQDMSFKFDSKPHSKHNKSKESNRHDLSFLINSLNNSKEDYAHNKLDTSFKFNKQSNQQILNKSLHDGSFVIDHQKAQKMQQDKEKVDFNQLFDLQLQEDISPIPQQSIDTSFVMRDPEIQNRKYSNKRNDDSYLDFKKQVKNKKKERIFEDDDEGY